VTTVPTHPPTQELLLPLRPALPHPRRGKHRAPRRGVATGIALGVLAIPALAQAVHLIGAAL
jgi:hypothetical protein